MSYTCNGSERWSCEGPRFGGCEWHQTGRFAPEPDERDATIARLEAERAWCECGDAITSHTNGNRCGNCLAGLDYEGTIARLERELAEAKKMIATSVAGRFWAKVEKTDGCWNWTGNRSQSGAGYGSMGLAGKLVGAHRVSYELHNGPIPPGQLVLHRCDNRACVRPDHLFLGTHRENTVDMVAKGRCWNRRLTDEDVRKIRALSEQGMASREVAKLFGIHEGTVRKIRARKAAKHVD